MNMGAQPNAYQQNNNPKHVKQILGAIMNEPTTSNSQLARRTVIITGGARGIGYTTAKQFALMGARVIILDINASLLDDARNSMQSDGLDVLAWHCDVTDEAEVETVVSRAWKEVGTIDVLVNNAGYSYHCAPEVMPKAEWDRTIAACLTATFLMSKAVARKLIDAGRPGTIVNLSSISGSTSLGRGIFAYGAAKAGIDGLTRDLAIEWASYGIRVNSVAPCQVRTEGFQYVADRQLAEHGDDLVARASRGIPLGRLAEPLDISNAIQFLASDAASMITGVVLPVDGGNLAMNPGATLRSAHSVS